MTRRIPLLAYDWTLILTVLAINLFGLAMIRSAASAPGLWITQAVWMTLAIAVALGIQFFSRRQVMSGAFLLYVVSIFLLVAVLMVGREVNGAKAWFVIGPARFQPSELAKIALVLALARWLANRPLERLWEYLVPIGLAAAMMVLVYAEDDLGGTIVLASILLGVLFVRGMPLPHLVLGLAAVAIVVPTLVWPNLKPYQKERVEIVLNPEKDPQGKGYQLIQSKIAIGSGHLIGKGYGKGTQTQLGFVPFRHTDFIYSVVAEEWGFVGSVGLLVLYGLLFLRLVRMALECIRLEDRLVIGGVLAMLSFQVLVNVAVTVGLAPITGLTLPLFSYGGSSLMFVYMALGLCLVMHRDRYRDL
jgi:rod shape determining protein RodA